jgi:hydrogenase maturation protein HypF
MGDGDEPVRVRLTVRGIVQGVGFRPFVHRLATQEGLVGSVVNTGAGVVIEAQGPAAAIGRFGKRLRAEAPPLAAIHDIASVLLPPAPGEGFVIDASRPQAGATTAVPPDVALCADCRREVRDPADRRFGYPFTNCTNCGPRWTIIESLPYDRPRTSMAAFTMCEACRAEYEDPADRRFHAQPNACPACGPRAWLCGEDGLGRLDDRPLAAAADALAKGLIVAVRGLGGFHLAVRADDHEAVARLRRRKHRAAKPLAVMVADVAAARALAEVTPGEEAVLTSPAAPIVLLAMHSGAAVAASVAPGHRHLGVMLPPTPLHLLLFDEVVARGIGALVMTSGNVADEPICIGNDDALEHLRGIADRWLLHDRPIARRADDSVLQVTAHGMLHVRRSRGYAPAPLPVAAPSGGAVLAVGGDLKNTVCLLKDGLAFLSPHVGELDDLATRAFFTETVDGLCSLLEATPVAIACDEHPGYAGAQWARREAERRGIVGCGVQHHHAHLAAVMAEHRLPGPCLGLILDGTGYGSDGGIWGGELLVGDFVQCERVGSFEPMPLPGGDAAIRAPWRIAVSYLWRAGLLGDDPRRVVDRLATDWPALARWPVAGVLEMLERDVNCPATSSCGRLFDAVAALAGICHETAYEAQAAMEFMALTDEAAVAAAAPFPGVLEELRRRKSGASAPCLELPTALVVRGAAEMIQAGAKAAEVSAAFHRTLADLLAEAVVLVHADRPDLPVVLGGGVFLNAILAAAITERLEQRGIRAHLPRVVSPGDGGLSLGQAMVAAHRLATKAN